jgi:hypothetical protein
LHAVEKYFSHVYLSLEVELFVTNTSTINMAAKKKAAPKKKAAAKKKGKK